MVSRFADTPHQTPERSSKVRRWSDLSIRVITTWGAVGCWAWERLSSLQGPQPSPNSSADLRGAHDGAEEPSTVKVTHPFLPTLSPAHKTSPRPLPILIKVLRGQKGKSSKCAWPICELIFLNVILTWKPSLQKSPPCPLRTPLAQRAGDTADRWPVGGSAGKFWSQGALGRGGGETGAWSGSSFPPGPAFQCQWETGLGSQG